jgi:hypothetical protein
MKHLQFRAFSFIRVLDDIPRSENRLLRFLWRVLNPPLLRSIQIVHALVHFETPTSAIDLRTISFRFRYVTGKPFVSHALTTLPSPFFPLVWKTIFSPGSVVPSNCAGYDDRDLADARVFRTHFSLSGCFMPGKLPLTNPTVLEQYLSAGQQWGLQGFELLTRRFPFNPPDFVDLESRRPRYAPGAKSMILFPLSACYHVLFVFRE